MTPFGRAFRAWPLMLPPALYDDAVAHGFVDPSDPAVCAMPMLDEPDFLETYEREDKGSMEP